MGYVPDINDFELTLTVGELRSIKAEVWDAAYEFYSDMLAMPHRNVNPYRG